MLPGGIFQLPSRFFRAGRSKFPVRRHREEAVSAPSPVSSTIVIGSRTDAVNAMRAVAAFYRQAEPSHPTPLLMDKACALAQHDFMSLLGNILPDVVPEPGSDS